MTTTTTVCDRCRQPIEANRTMLESKCGPALGEVFDLCPECLAAFKRWLRNDQYVELAEPVVKWETV